MVPDVSWPACGKASLRERKICFHVLEICFGNERCLTQVTLTLAVFLLEKVPLALFPPQYLTGTGHLETLGDRFPSLGFSCSASHGARRLSVDAGNSRDFPHFRRF